MDNTVVDSSDQNVVTDAAVTKFALLLKKKGITAYRLNWMMKDKGYPSVNVNTLKKIIDGKKAVVCNLSGNESYPCLLQRICITLGVKSKDVIEY